ncbi:MAG: hypothetical protein KME12_01585 [Trichocoleus desertorum ATA4-8-CV12]|nr:hypothetical protein [Trichocoleus desertorum ATA4-8-CV12]
MTRPINLAIFNKTAPLCQVYVKRCSDRHHEVAWSDRQTVSLSSTPLRLSGTQLKQTNPSTLKCGFS